jgi:hypothetical protein
MADFRWETRGEWTTNAAADNASWQAEGASPDAVDASPVTDETLKWSEFSDESRGSKVDGWEATTSDGTRLVVFNSAR